MHIMLDIICTLPTSYDCQSTRSEGDQLFHSCLMVAKSRPNEIVFGRRTKRVIAHELCSCWWWRNGDDSHCHAFGYYAGKRGGASRICKGGQRVIVIYCVRMACCVCVSGSAAECILLKNEVRIFCGTLRFAGNVMQRVCMHRCHLISNEH